MERGYLPVDYHHVFHALQNRFNSTKVRNNFFLKISKYKKVDSGGLALNNIGYIVKNKLEFIKDYKFTIAFENSSYSGYTTEKITDAFISADSNRTGQARLD